MYLKNLFLKYIKFIFCSILFIFVHFFKFRESQGRVEELETANTHLQRRLDKLKNARSTLLKEI